MTKKVKKIRIDLTPQELMCVIDGLWHHGDFYRGIKAKAKRLQA